MNAIPENLPLIVSAFFILFARTGAVLMLLPVFSEDAVPGRIRLLIAFGMTSGIWPLQNEAALAVAQSGPLPAVLIAELLTGLAMGMIVKILFYAISMAGSIISMQIGLSAAMLFDPAQGSQVPLLSKFVTMAAAIVCMAMQVHHLWIQSIVESYNLFPIGGLPPAQDFAQMAIAAINRSMMLAVGLAAPLLIYGIVFNVALGLAARVAPAIQVFFISQPLNIMLGMALTAMTLGTVLTVFATEMGQAMLGGWR
ncbi:flagellar biosynthetic protein FliR [Stakelama tenebrarum]|uniref:Flagellar biosynthetic protein FliR n=1 Tax=Stakelama tenebrarum TaxID=2711215 RepID=A0A6G6Y466_9SPHN|nr:flagellar biosynthetic protein FliR [Sphingosinithalassobacter tenebrarum]QIG79705.1 flagellar biosynthetic protein FliR [Sphingosinithalassobacter tenebrarum]